MLIWPGNDIRLTMKWERLPIAALPAWAKINGIEFSGVRMERLKEQDVDKGSAILAAQDFLGDVEEQLLLVPREMVLSLGGVQEFAKSDARLREVLEAVEEFALVGA